MDCDVAMLCCYLTLRLSHICHVMLLLDIRIVSYIFKIKSI